MNILITGSQGYIGKALCEMLCKKYKVIGLTSSTIKQNDDYKLIKVIGGINAVFSSKKIVNENNFKILNTNFDYKEGVIRNKIYKQNAKNQFQTIKHLKLIRI